MCSKPRTFGATQKSLFNVLPKTLFMCVVYDASHIYSHKKAVKKDPKKALPHTECSYHVLLCMLILSMFGVCCVFKMEKCQN